MSSYNTSEFLNLNLEYEVCECDFFCLEEKYVSVCSVFWFVGRHLVCGHKVFTRGEQLFDDFDQLSNSVLETQRKGEFYMNCVRGWQIIKVTKSFSSWVSSTHMWPWVLKLLLTL